MADDDASGRSATASTTARRTPPAGRLLLARKSTATGSCPRSRSSGTTRCQSHALPPPPWISANVVMTGHARTSAGAGTTRLRLHRIRAGCRSRARPARRPPVAAHRRSSPPRRTRCEIWTQLATCLCDVLLAGAHDDRLLLHEVAHRYPAANHARQGRLAAVLDEPLGPTTVAALCLPFSGTCRCRRPQAALLLRPPRSPYRPWQLASPRA